METLAAAYGSDSEDREGDTADGAAGGDAKGPAAPVAQASAAAPPARSSVAIQSLAPDVDVSLSSNPYYVKPGTKTVYHNPRVQDMWVPVQGPTHPDDVNRIGAASNVYLGHVERTTVDEFVFAEQFNTFNSFGYAQNPSDSAQNVVGDVAKYLENRGRTVYTTGNGPKRKRQKVDPREWKSAPAAPPLTEEERAEVSRDQQKPESRPKPVESKQETTQFHGAEIRDYQGRTYMHIPLRNRSAPPDRKCYIPKRCIHTWRGHSKGVNRIQFFPNSGHLLLSASMDSTVKLWDVYNKRQLLRTYSGHSGAVRDVNFSSDGKRFVTASYDRYVKVWDTEYGKCISRHTSKKIPYCVKLNPKNDNECLVGQGDKLIVQWDFRADEIVQRYSEHLATVNSVTFCDNDRRFISTSDDKKVFVWEYGIPVVIKHISEPDMHSMPAAAVHPNGKWWIGQSMDNTVRVYSCGARFKENVRKVFRGHHNAGYACQLGFSPDGRFVISGDGHGRCFFWDWKTSRVFEKLRCHDKVCIGAAWHPIEPSRVATCSWDGLIKYWD